MKKITKLGLLLCLLIIIPAVKIMRAVVKPQFLTPKLTGLHLQHLLFPDLIPGSNCNVFNYRYMIHNRNFCGENGGANVFLLIIVPSHHPNIAARNAIRKTWGSVREHNGLQVMTLFVFGVHSDERMNQQVRNEAEYYGDVIQAKLQDKYTTLTNKTIMALKWVSLYCPGVKYIMKTDDNTYNFPSRYVEYISGITSIHRKNNMDTSFVGGSCVPGWPELDPEKAYYTGKEVYKTEYYPMYCLGPAYVMSHSALRRILDIASSALYLPWEDVFTTGICREAANLRYVDIPGTRHSLQDITKCNIHSAVKSIHPVQPSDMIRLWHDADSMVVTADGKVAACYSLVSVHGVMALLFVAVLLYVGRMRRARLLLYQNACRCLGRVYQHFQRDHLHRLQGYHIICRITPRFK